MPEAQRAEESPAPIQITQRAAERLADEMVATEGNVEGLRVLVQPGDCGLRYGLSFVRDGAQEREISFTSEGIQVFLDEDALPFVEGATVDFQKTLIGEGFQIDNPNEDAGRCGPGCGCR